MMTLRTVPLKKLPLSENYENLPESQKFPPTTFFGIEKKIRHKIHALLEYAEIFGKRKLQKLRDILTTQTHFCKRPIPNIFVKPPTFRKNLKKTQKHYILRIEQRNAQEAGSGMESRSFHNTEATKTY